MCCLLRPDSRQARHSPSQAAFLSPPVASLDAQSVGQAKLHDTQKTSLKHASVHDMHMALSLSSPFGTSEREPGT